MKRRIALLLVVGLLAAMLAGCGSTSSGSESASEAPAEAESAAEEAVSEEPEEAEEAEEPEEVPEEPEAPAEEPAPAEEESAPEEAPEQETIDYTTIYPLDDTVTLTAWAMWIPGIEQYVDSPSDTLVMQEMEKITNVKIDMSLASSPDTAMTEINLLIASGSYPDLINNFAGYYSAGIDSAISEEIIVNLADYSDLLPDFLARLEERGAMDDAVTDSGNIGSVYQINTGYDLDAEAGLVLRQDWMEEQGLDDPKTYDDLYDILMTFKSAYGISSPLFVSKTGIPDSMFDGFGLGLDFQLNTEMGSAPWNYVETDDGLEVVFGFMDDTFYDALVLLNSWYNDGLFTSDYMNNNYNVDASDLVSGDSACFFCTQSVLNSANTFQEHMYKAYPMISEDGSKISQPASQYSAISAQGYSVTTACEDIETALQYLNYQYTDDTFILNNYGIEGQTFNYNDAGDPVLSDLIMNNEDGISQSYTQFIYLSVTGSFYCDSDRFKSNYCEEAKECFDGWDSSYDYYDSKYNTNNIQLTQEEKEEYSQSVADISTYCVEMVASFITGQTEVNEANFETFRENLVSMGIED